MLASDIMKEAELTYSYNYPSVPFFREDIRQIPLDKFKKVIGDKEVDVIIGGPMLQVFQTWAIRTHLIHGTICLKIMYL